jgi:hypothetical protein
MAKYLKKKIAVEVRPTRDPYHDRLRAEHGIGRMVDSNITRYLSLNEDNEGAILDIQHPLYEPNFDERIGWSKEGAETLFDYKPAEAEYAMSNESMRHTFPKLYAMALEDFKDITPSTDRSERSERLARKGADMKVVPDTERKFTNDLQYMISPVGEGQNLETTIEPWQEVPKHGVDRAVNRLRSELGYSRRLSPQFDALQKFEQDRDAVYNPSQDPNAMKIPGMD